MFSEINNSKEVIRNRMLRHAMNYWNIKNTEDLDPMVKLLMEALSTELYNLGNEVKDTEVRLLEKIATLLAPDFLTCPQPAHAILHAMPVEPEELLKENTQLFTQKKISSKQDETLDKNIDVFFTVAGCIKLYQLRVSHIFSGNTCCSFNMQGQRQVLAQAAGGKKMDNNIVWLGLDLNERIADIGNLFFYFDWKDPGFQSTLNYQLLPLCRWFLPGDRELEISPGIIYEEKNSPENNELFSDHETLRLVEEDTRNFYSARYISIKAGQLKQVQQLRETCPQALQAYLSDSDRQKLTTPLLWIKIVFPAAIQQGALDELSIYCNSFPVMNRRLYDGRFRMKGNTHIIPLKVSANEQFLAVHTVSDESKPYRSNPFRKMEEEDSGTYTVRSGGIERFDGRNAREFISYMLELLRSESAAFSAYGNDFISSTLREMNQRIALMEQKTKTLSGLASEMPHYIIAKPNEGNETIFVEYWTTLAETANSIRSGTRMQEYSGVKLRADSIFLLSTTTGGKNRLKPEEKVNAFRYGLMTRNRVVTKEDIRNFCHYELGNSISAVSVEKGFELSLHQQQGFRRTIDITLTASGNEAPDPESWQLLSNRLLAKLKSRSGMSNHYRIFVKK